MTGPGSSVVVVVNGSVAHDGGPFAPMGLGPDQELIARLDAVAVALGDMGSVMDRLAGRLDDVEQGLVELRDSLGVRG